MPDGQTDERLEAPVKQKRDMDSRFLAGCLTIAFLSLVFWILTAWPFFVFPVHLKSGLLNAFVFGPLPALVLGVVLVRIRGLEAATALAGGGLAAGVFAYLHLGNLSLGRFADTSDLPPPDYPTLWVWLLPLAWCFAIDSVIFLALPRREVQDEAPARSDRQ